MKIAKLIENVSKNKIDDMTVIKVVGKPDLILHIDEDNNKSFFTDENNNVVDIMNYINDDFELDMQEIRQDVWDEVDKQLNENNNSTIRTSIGTKNKVTGVFPKFTEEMMRDFIMGRADVKRSKDGKGYEFYSLGADADYKEYLKNYSYSSDQSYNFFCTGDGYLDAATLLISDYDKRFEKAYDYGNIDKNRVSYGYQQDAIIKTLLAFSCECYLKSLLLFKGMTISDLKKLSHGLVDLFSAVGEDIMSDIFLDMEANGYGITKYENKNRSYDNPELTEKFMLDLAITDDAFIDSRYCAEKDKNTNYAFLLGFAQSLKRISNNTLNVKSCFDKDNYRNR